MMRKNKSSKKIIAVALAIIMVVTSIPFMMIGSAAGVYDPAPYFDDAAKEKGANAWLDDDGNVQVVYPAATARPTFKGDALSIAFYILELVDTGAKDAVHTNSVIKTIKATGTSATFNVTDIGNVDLENNRYSVTVTAVDTENWFSEPIYATVVKVPAVTIDSSRFANLSSSPTAAREMATFDSDTTSDSTAVASGNALQFMGVAKETGTVDLADYVSDTPALRFIMHNQPTGTQSFYTAYSRQTWDFKGAEEVWYWLDFTDVSLQGVAFTLGAQCKTVLGWADGKNVDVSENEVIHYSTKGTTYSAYTGETPYVWIQREDGGWNKVMMSNGTVDIANFKGYVRVPLKFFCSTENRYITTTNTEFGTNNKSVIASTNNIFASSNDLRPKTQANGDAYVASQQSATPILADPAGTPISEALMLQYRQFNCAEHIKLGVSHGTMDGWNIGYMPAAAVGADDADSLYTVTSDPKRATVNLSAGTVTRNSDTYRAIEDLKTMGFSFENCTADSLSHSFYVDNVFFYRTDGKAYTENSLNNTPNTGNPISDYYNEELTIQSLIFDEIDKYIVTPGWEDFREINYILDLIEAYRQIFAANGKSTAFLDLSETDDGDGVGLAAAAAKLKRDSWANAWKAYKACAAEGTYGRANAGKFDLVPTMVRLIEKLPQPENITTVSSALRDEIIKLWKGYSLLNLGQLEMLGQNEEETILKYIALLEGNVSEDFDELVVGTSLSNRPFILFDDFENYDIGTKSYQLEDAADIYYDGETAYTDYRYTKNFVTYMPDTFEDFGGKSKDTDNSIAAFLWGKQPTKNGFADNLIPNVTRGEITNSGFQNTKGATILVDGNMYKSGEGLYNVVSTTYKGAEAANIDALRATGTGNSNVLLGNMAKSFSGGTIDPYLSLVFYADFTQITDFNVSVTIQTYFDDTLNDFQIAMGTAATDQNFFILDETTGEWVQANNAEDAGRMFAYTSKAGSDTNGDGVFDITLAGYKGFIRIPLYHFKPGNNSQKLDESSLALNNIYRISIGVAPGSQDGANQMYGKSFTIDNIGFSYDPVQYASEAATRAGAGVVDENFDEFFGAKGLPAKQFEDAVADIDLYNDVEFKSKYNVAMSLYSQLTEYQKSVVTDAYKTLIEYYKPYYDGTIAVPPEEYSPVQLSEFVDSLPDAMKDAQVTGTYIDENGEDKSYDIPYPGFSNGQVNYAAMGIDKAKALEIIDYYNKGYSLFSKSQKYDILSETTRTQFLNAYNMAMRLTVTLEDIKVNAVGEDGRSGFLADLTGLYTVKYDYNDDGVLDDKDDSITNGDNYKIGNFVSIEGKQRVSDFKSQKYDVLPYYSKTSIDDGSIYAGLQNTSRGFTYFLNNTRSFTIDGESEPIEGGILTFQEKMDNIYKMASENITNKELFTPEELQSVKDIIAEYNALLPAYYNVEELYELEQAIIRLFPDYGDVTLDVNEILLSEEKLIGDAATYKVTYAEVLDLNNKGDHYFVRITSKKGAMTNAYGNSVDYNIAIGSKNTTSSAIVEANPYVAKVENNTYTPDNPMSFVIVPSLDAKPTGLRGAVYDDITVELVYSETVAETVDGNTTEKVVETVVREQIITVSYSMGDAYTVTIPGSFPVEWGDTKPQDVSYSVTTEMVATSKLTVGVADDGTKKMYSTVDPSYALDYTTENFVDKEFGNRVTDAKPDPAPTVTVSGWENVPVGEYKTTLTYSVVYDNGSNT